MEVYDLGLVDPYCRDRVLVWFLSGSVAPDEVFGCGGDHGTGVIHQGDVHQLIDLLVVDRDDFLGRLDVVTVWVDFLDHADVLRVGCGSWLLSTVGALKAMVAPIYTRAGGVAQLVALEVFVIV